MLTLNVYSGDLGIDEGTPRSVFQLDTTGMEQLTGGDTGVDSIELMPGEPRSCRTASARSTSRPRTLDTGADDYSQSVPRFASFDVHHDPSQGWVLVFAVLIIGGLLVSLFIPRRRMWVKAVTRPDGTIVLEYAGLARGDDPGPRARGRGLRGQARATTMRGRPAPEAPDDPLPRKSST